MDIHKSSIEDFKTDLWHFHFKVPQDIAREFIDGNNRRVICTLNKVKKFPCALMPSGEEGCFINVNKEIRKELGLREGDAIEYSLEKDESEYGLPMPEELGELLKIDNEANDFFHALTPGKQRNLIYIVGKPKLSATRMHKALGITEFLKEHKGDLDFKLLNTFMKTFNKL